MTVHSLDPDKGHIDKMVTHTHWTMQHAFDKQSVSQSNAHVMKILNEDLKDPGAMSTVLSAHNACTHYH